MIKILVIGEYCIDRFIYCEVRRFSPEAPVPVLTPFITTENNGMSGNVVENLKSLKKDLKITHLHQGERITKTRYVERKSNHMFLRVDEGEDDIKPLLSCPEFIENKDMVIVSDYNKGFLTDDILYEIGTKSKLSILDSKRKLSKNIINSFTFVKLNESEAKENNELSKIRNVIVTLGSKGAKYQNKIYPNPKPQETIDVSGAGDTFTASFILKYHETNNIDESLIFANEMASIVVSKRGVTVPNRNYESN
jgi:D-beta-D-heptose 7-phosphate kinase/D-beta-D-heptose 1-phosphate adenosyltransferase